MHNYTHTHTHTHTYTHTHTHTHTNTQTHTHTHIYSGVLARDGPFKDSIIIIIITIITNNI